MALQGRMSLIVGRAKLAMPLASATGSCTARPALLHLWAQQMQKRGP